MTGFRVSRSTVQRLVDWGRWSQTEKIRPRCYGTLGNLAGSTVKSVLVDNDEAEFIDRIVSRLKFRDREMGSVIFFYYHDNLPIRKIAEKTGSTKSKVDGLKMQGEAWVDAAIFSASMVA